MKIVYIAHPIAGDVEKNLEDLKRILRKINTGTLEVCPVAPYAFSGLDDSDKIERERGIMNNIELIKTKVFKELWLTGDKISAGMKQEIELFTSLGIPVFNFTKKF